MNNFLQTAFRYPIHLHSKLSGTAAPYTAQGHYARCICTADTTFYSGFYFNLVRRGIINDFMNSYLDVERKDLTAVFPVWMILRKDLEPTTFLLKNYFLYPIQRRSAREGDLQSRNRDTSAGERSYCRTSLRSGGILPYSKSRPACIPESAGSYERDDITPEPVSSSPVYHAANCPGLYSLGHIKMNNHTLRYTEKSPFL